MISVRSSTVVVTESFCSRVRVFWAVVPSATVTARKSVITGVTLVVTS
ncbi:hypothetical protein [Streptomyces sp. G45]